MSEASIETTLEFSGSIAAGREASDATAVFTRPRGAFGGNFLDGLLGEERRRTGWMRAEAAGDPGPWRQLAVLGRGHWGSDALRDIVRDYALETLADNNTVLVVDETGFLNWGRRFAAVAGTIRISVYGLSG